MPIEPKLIGAAIRRFRLQRGFTQRDLAERSGLAANYIAVLERGERPFSTRNLNAIAKPLGVPASYFTILGTSKSQAYNADAAKILSKTKELIESLLCIRNELVHATAVRGAKKTKRITKRPRKKPSLPPA